MRGFFPYGGRSNAFLEGDPNETVSSRAAKASHKTHWKMLGDILDWIDPGYMQQSAETNEDNKATFGKL